MTNNHILCISIVKMFIPAALASVPDIATTENILHKVISWESVSVAKTAILSIVVTEAAAN